ncbi:SpoIIE family protein phosphatase [Streptomyces lushanensis]|uniref:SpoIIE family protein phosphatase n=1 Tax=Streptomyces lushanensis TaxID=1434255 RepID=UPI00083107E5|nr:SpoIIE family protein phosphatase [Streptomyces lushanensis]
MTHGERPMPRGAPSDPLGDELRADLSRAMELNGIGGFVWDVESARVLLDPSAVAIFDLEPGAFDGRISTLYRRIAPEERSGIRMRVAQVFSDPRRSTSCGNYFRVRRADGTTRWAHSQAVVVRDESGRPVRVVGVLRAEPHYAEEQSTLESERRHQAGVVQATTTALSQALGVEDVLTALTGHEILGPVGAVGISLTVLEQNRLRRLATVGMPAAYVRDMEYGRLDDDRPIAEVFRTQNPLFVTRKDIRTDYSMLWPYIKGTGFTASAVLPLMAQARLTGVLAILYEGKKGFSPEERNLLTALSATVAQSFQRALLYDEEHAMAVGLQQAMLPAKIETVPGMSVAARYRPARAGHQIGGDWYDVMPLPEGRVGLVVGDVQGHDIQAAAVMGQLRTALRAYATEGHSPAELMSRASAFLRDLDTERLATCVYVSLGPATGQAEIVRAGHPSPHIRTAHGSAQLAVEGGPPLGLPPDLPLSRPDPGDVPYPVHHFCLGPRETLLLCTDGLLEFHDTDMAAGERQIQVLLDSGPGPGRLDQLAEHIVASIENRQGQEDDVALLLASRTPPHPSLATS